MKSIQAPVLGCSIKPDLKAHIRVFCLGFLSEEHFAVLSVLLDHPLQVNLSGCSNCKNGFIVDILKERLQDVEKKLPAEPSKILKLIEKNDDLDYQDISYNRRDLFQVLRNGVHEVSGFIVNDDRDRNSLAYTHKSIPQKRDLLNRVQSVLSGRMKNEIKKNFYYDLNIDKRCNRCCVCIGMCPTGALKSALIGSEKRLFFNCSLCTGCGLCVCSCMKQAITLHKGLSVFDPFEFRLCDWMGTEAQASR
jgi:Fe-S-cluster-containing hydrogenase component 2